MSENRKVRKAGWARLQSRECKWKTGGAAGQFGAGYKQDGRQCSRGFMLKQPDEDGNEVRRGRKPCQGGGVGLYQVRGGRSGDTGALTKGLG